MFLTANCCYDYDYTHTNGKTLYEKANEVNNAICTVFGWKFKVLKRGTYGADLMVTRIGHLLNKSGDSFGTDRKVFLLHEAWKTTYYFWSEMTPWEYDSNYTGPFRNIKTKRHEKKLASCWTELSDYQKWIDIEIVYRIGISSASPVEL